MMIMAVVLGLLPQMAFGAPASSSKNGVGLLAEPEFKELSQGLPPEDIFRLSALLNIRLGQYEQAIAQLRVLTKNNPDSQTWGLLAVAYNAVAHWKLAYEASAKAIALEPDSLLHHQEHGVAALNLGKYPEAEDDLLICVKADSNNDRARFHLALAQAYLEKRAQARQNLIKAQALNSKLAGLANYYLGQIAAGQGKLVEAEIDLRKALEVSRDKNLPIYQKAGRSLSKIKKADAIQTARKLEKALALVDAKNALKNTPVPCTSAR